MSKNWINQAGTVRNGESIDTKKLSDYLQDTPLASTSPIEVRQFSGGYSNLTYALHIGENNYVLRRPPFGTQIKSAHDMGREYRILDALYESYRKVPKPHLFCNDNSIIGVPFYIMNRVDGLILRPTSPSELTPTIDEMHDKCRSLIDSFIDLHNIDFSAVGLDSLGRPQGYVTRQITGWNKRYVSAQTSTIDNMEKIAKWLTDHIPDEQNPSLIHNDYKYDNVVWDMDKKAKIIAILDWEMATIGDPLMDLGTSLGYWVNEDDPDWMRSMSLNVTTLSGNFSRDEFAHYYLEKSGRSTDNIVFYYVYGLFKIAVILQQIFRRYKMGHSQDPKFAHLDKMVIGLANMAMQAISKNRMDRLF